MALSQLPVERLGDGGQGADAVAYEHVYVHVPFCGRRCSYCDFAIAVRRSVPSSEYVDAILAEMVTRRVGVPWGKLRTIYLGGGTPSKLDGAQVGRLLAGVSRAFGVEKLSTLGDAAEITLEANPEDVSAKNAESWVAAGVNRVSLGVQSFEPEVLRWMHREHSVEQVAEAVRVLRAAGVGRLSLDLIFALPDSLERDWSRDLERVLELRPDHLSLYGLTVEPHTPLGRWTARGEVQEAPEERYESEFLEAHRRLASAGFEHYEVSNYATVGRVAEHNSAYWKGVPYVGLGPSAHGFDGRVRRWNRSAYADWLRAVRAGADPLEGSEVITADAAIAEAVYLGLRTSTGFDIRQNELTTVMRFVDAGWATLSGTRLRLTPSGWLRLDAIAASLTSLRSPS